MGSLLPFLHIVFVPDDDGLDLIVGVVLHLEEPLVEALEGIAFGEVEDQKGSDGRFVVRPCYRLE